MINLLVAYDDNDSELGDYFQESFDSLNSEVAKSVHIVSSSIRGLDCTEGNINAQIATFNSEHFIFVGFSHGNDEQLLTEQEVFVSDNNSHSFAQSFFYTSACSCCSVLGGQLIKSGCLSFIGYNGTVDVWEGYYDVFIECENYGIIQFITTSKTIGESFSEMKEKYNEAIDQLVALGGIEDTIVASLLIGNRDKLTLLGNPDLVITDFHI